MNGSPTRPAPGTFCLCWLTLPLAHRLFARSLARSLARASLVRSLIRSRFRAREISIRELLDDLGLPRTRFAKRVFEIFDADGSGEIDVREFFVTTWNYCTLSKTALGLFAFDLYDRDDSGTIDRHEMEKARASLCSSHLLTSYHVCLRAAPCVCSDRVSHRHLPIFV